MTVFRVWQMIMVATLTMGSAVANATEAKISPTLWALPRTGRTILAQSAIHQAVGRYLQQPNNIYLIIHRAAGDESMAKAEELRSWLISLAVEASHISILGDLAANQPLRVETRKQ